MKKTTSPRITKALDSSTEEKIKEAARKLFTQKGFAAVKTREIAAEAGINLALLNYYFRSKEKLFNIIMMESMGQFVQGISALFIDKKMPLNEKIAKLSESYIDMLIKHPDLPLFILNAMKSNPQQIASRMTNEMGLIRSGFIKQIEVSLKKGKSKDIHVMHFVANMISLMVFPFVAAPMLQHITGVDQKKFNELMEERKKLVPVWIKAMMMSG